eukprot:Nitzschia sp. Nitz4//scaffold126_size65214//25831//26340//NITZ4_006152-RA/size65214-exonerate_est2genome-gene-0.31-mRNA-1//1//CDS//3329534677//8270//frame0
MVYPPYVVRQSLQVTTTRAVYWYHSKMLPVPTSTVMLQLNTEQYAIRGLFSGMSQVEIQAYWSNTTLFVLPILDSQHCVSTSNHYYNVM